MANYYFSGQGSLYSAKRDAATGKPLGFVNVGNVPELSIDIEVTKFEHKESESGNRLLDLTLVKEKKGKFKMKMENVSLDNLAIGLYGDVATVAQGPVVAEQVKFYKGMRMPLAHPDVSLVVVSLPAALNFPATTAVALNALYKPATSNGHYYRVSVAGTTAAAEPTWPTNGATVVSGTATFIDMGTNVKVLGTDYTVDAKNGILIFPATGSALVDGDTLSVDYTHAAYTNLEAFTQSVSPERWLRFEGLNTVDGSHVIVDCFKSQFDPLTGYTLINDEIAAIDMGGTLLADAFITNPASSKFFRQRNVAA